MRFFVKIILATLLTVLLTQKASGEAPSDSVKVFFLIGHSQFNPTIDNNREAMDLFIELVRKAKEENRLDSIIVRAYASPDGASKANFKLSGRRCENVADIIARRADINPEIILTKPEGVAWDELRRLVAENPEVPAREKILHILDNVPLWVYNSKGVIIDGKKKQLMDLERGVPYRWMFANIFPKLRNAVAVSLYAQPSKPAGESDSSRHRPTMSDTVRHRQTPSDTIGQRPIASDSLSQAVSLQAAETARALPPRYLALKTNMLFDALLIPNIGAEFYLGKNLSLYGEWMYGWWDNNNRHRYWRLYGGDLGLRWWFGRKAEEKPLTGHHLGIYGGVLTFDFEWGSTGYMGGKPGGTLWDRCLVNAGIEYGYSLPIARRLNIDFSIGLGFLGGNYIKYFPFDDDYFREKEVKLRFFGPTKAEISLVWLLGRGNTNNRKGGDQ